MTGSHGETRTGVAKKLSQAQLHSPEKQKDHKGGGFLFGEERETLHFRHCAGFGLNQLNTGVVVRVRDEVFATGRCKRNKRKQVFSPPR